MAHHNEQRDREMAEYIAANPGIKYEDVGKRFGLTKQRVGFIASTARFQEYLKHAKQLLYNSDVQEVKELVASSTKIGLNRLKSELQKKKCPPKFLLDSMKLLLGSVVAIQEVEAKENQQITQNNMFFSVPQEIADAITAARASHMHRQPEQKALPPAQ